MNIGMVADSRRRRPAAALLAAWLAMAAGAVAQVEVAEVLQGRGDETAALRSLLAGQRHVALPAGRVVTIGAAVDLPAATTLEGPGTIHLAGRDAGLRLGPGCAVRNVRFTCAPAFAHGAAIAIVTDRPGTVRRMDCQVSGCSFELMRGCALRAVEVSHLSFADNTWENHSATSLYYNATLLMDVRNSRFRANTILHANQGLLFRGGTDNVISDNYIENCLQGITCHTVGSHPRHWPWTLFARNVIANNVIRRAREEGITYDNSMGRTPAADAAQNQVRAVATVAEVTAVTSNRFRLRLAEPANEGRAYTAGWADGYYAGLLSGAAAATLLEVIASGAEGGGWIELPRQSEALPARIRPGDRVWIAAGCFHNLIAGNAIDNGGMVSGTGNATCIGLWGAAWYNRIDGNNCITRQYGITIGAVGLAPPDSPQGPCAANDISHNSVSASWRSAATTFSDQRVGAIATVCIGAGPLLGERLFLANRIDGNRISWVGKWPIRLTQDTATVVSGNLISDEEAAFSLEETTDAIIEGNRTASGRPIASVIEQGRCSYRLIGAAPP